MVKSCSNWLSCVQPCVVILIIKGAEYIGVLNLIGLYLIVGVMKQNKELMKERDILLTVGKSICFIQWVLVTEVLLLTVFNFKIFCVHACISYKPTCVCLWISWMAVYICFAYFTRTLTTNICMPCRLKLMMSLRIQRTKMIS